MCASKKCFVSLDIGGTAIKYGLLDATGKILIAKEDPTRAREGVDALLEQLYTLVKEMQQALPIDAEMAGIGISTAGVVDADDGKIEFVGPAFPGYSGTELKKRMEDQFHVPCEVENDVNSAGLAEAMQGAGKAYSHMLMLTIGTNVGGCYIHEGNVFHGVSNAGCELGYMPFRDFRFELYGSTTALVKDVAARKQEAADAWDGRRIFEAAKAGDGDCAAAIEQLCQTIAQGIGMAACVLNPDVVVLGGGIMAQQDYLRPLLETALDACVPGVIREAMDLQFASMGNQAGMIGAWCHLMAKHPELGA